MTFKRLLITTTALVALTVTARAEVTKIADVGTWTVSYTNSVAAGMCQAGSIYEKTKTNIWIGHAYRNTQTRDTFWALMIENKDWTWVKSDEKYELVMELVGPGTSIKRFNLTFEGAAGGSIVAPLTKEIVSAMSPDKGEVTLILRAKDGKTVGNSAGWRLGTIQQALNVVVKCLKDRQPVERVATTPNPTPTQPSKSWSGSGFFVTKGYVVTNAHVVKGCTAMPKIKFPGYKPMDAGVKATDEGNDLALLETKLPTDAVPSFRFNIKLGEQVAAFGFPYGTSVSATGAFTLGNVTALNQNNTTSGFQLSTQLQPGSSGGPLIDSGGRVIGMAVGILGTLQIAEKAGGAVPQNVNFGITGITIVGFLQANGIDVKVDPSVLPKLEPEAIAEHAKKFTVQVTCDK